jgi:molybdopterin/thiamine biosynthesis adenylyltransferase
MAKQQEWGKEVFSLLSWFKADKVKNAKVLVVGAGALGNEVMKNLALFGVGNILVVDFDTIDYSNLTRSVLFRESDADKGKFKAEVAAARLREINPTINVQFIIGNLSTDVGLGLYRKMDVIIGCLDSPLSRLQLNRICMRAGKPWVDGGIFDMDGNAKVFVPGKNCYECEMPESSRNKLAGEYSCGVFARKNESAGRIPTTPVIASIIGAIQVQEAMKLIHKEELEQGVFTSLCGNWFHYNGHFLKADLYSSEKFEDTCSSHEFWDPVMKFPWLSAETTLKNVLDMIKKELKVKNVKINLRNDRFVEKIITRSDSIEFFPRIPESRIPSFLEKNPEFRQRLQRDLDLIRIENLTEQFPYPEMTLQQIGIPYYDVLQVTTEKGYFYTELSADESRFSI